MENENKGGPKTTEGKAISKMNALKHGLLSREVLLSDDDPKTLQELAQSITEALKPVGEIEGILTDRIISSTWRLRRSLRVERGTMQWYKDYEDMFPDLGSGGDKESQKLKEMIDNNAIDKIIRYEASIERSIFKALHELERLQARRNGKDIPLPIPIDVDTGKNE